MLLRVLVFAGYAAIGGVASYGAVYVFTPFGVMLLGACLFAALALPEPGRSRWPEILGLAAGPGVLLLLVASHGDAAAGLAGTAIVATALVAYAVAGRARCRRAA
jgi:hypothetical protein